MKLSLGFSPCPNDTFIFDALIHQKIDTKGLSFEVFYEDVESLNDKALQQNLDITKLSYYAYAHVAENYALLDAGSALGFGVGPLLIGKKDRLLAIQEGLKAGQSDFIVGIPGNLTTANFLLSIAYPKLTNKKPMLFSDIEQALIDGDIDLGLIIHENRFTYEAKGLACLMDLGNYWEQSNHAAIPLGGIAIKRSLPVEIQQEVNKLVRASVEYAFAHPNSGINFIKEHAQAMEESVMRKHIDLYVNEYSLSLGVKGKEAIELLYKKAQEQKLIPQLSLPLFV